VDLQDKTMKKTERIKDAKNMEKVKKW